MYHKPGHYEGERDKEQRKTETIYTQDHDGTGPRWVHS